MGVKIELIHHEAARGQYEIVAHHETVLEAVDKYILIK
jgi:glutamine synthetase